MNETFKMKSLIQPFFYIFRMHCFLKYFCQTLHVRCVTEFWIRFCTVSAMILGIIWVIRMYKMNPYLLHMTKHPPHDCWFLKVFSSLDCLAVHFSYPILIRASFTYLLRIRRILQISRNIPHAYVLFVLSFKN